MGYLLLLGTLYCPVSYANNSATYLSNMKNGVSNLFSPQSSNDFNQLEINTLSNFQLDTSKVQELPPITQYPHSFSVPSVASPVQPFSFNEAILSAVQRSPDISQNVALLASQDANIDVAKAGYYPTISGGLSTADLSSGERGRQLLSLNATQMVYDFGKVKSGIDVQKAKLASAQADVLVSMDNVALETADALINVKRYQELTKIAQQQIKGIARIAEITNLRAKAGISTQADPVQAQSNLQAAQSILVEQESQLRQYKQKLRTLLGFDISVNALTIPDSLVKESSLYEDPDFKKIPELMAANAEVEVAQFQKKQTKLSSYPTLNLKGSLSQAVNGKNPNNNEDDGMYSSIMFEASSNFYQGGAIASQARAASYAEEAAKAKVNSVYLNVVDQVRAIREQIENKQQQIGILISRREISIRTKELYQEQYKLGTRSAVDLLNAEQAIHSAAQEIENARFDIYAAIAKYIAVTGRTRDIYNLNNISIQGFEIQP